MQFEREAAEDMHHQFAAQRRRRSAWVRHEQWNGGNLLFIGKRIWVFGGSEVSPESSRHSRSRNASRKPLTDKLQ